MSILLIYIYIYLNVAGYNKRYATQSRITFGNSWKWLDFAVDLHSSKNFRILNKNKYTTK